MVKQFLKIAGVKTQKEFYKKYPSEAAFFRAHPEAEMLKHAAMGGGYYQQGGMMPPPQQGAPDAGGQDKLQQIVQMIMQALQQGVPPQEIVKKLVELGLPQQDAMEMVQMVVQKMQGAGGGQPGGPEPNGVQEYPQGQEPPMEEGQEPPSQQSPQEEQQEEQPQMRRGGMPCYNCGGMYADGGMTNGTYYQGTYFAGGGPFLPEYSDHAYNVYQQGGSMNQSSQLIQKVAEMIQQGIDPQVVYQQLIQAKIPKKTAMQIIQTVVGQLQQGAAQQQPQQMAAYGGPYMELSNRMNSTNFAKGGSYLEDGDLGVTTITTRYPMTTNSGNVPHEYSHSVGRPYTNSEFDERMRKEMINKGYNIPYQYGNSLSQLAAQQATEQISHLQNLDKLKRLNEESANYFIDPTSGGIRTQPKNTSGRKFKEGGEYEMSHNDIQKLIQQGYKIQYL